MNAFKRGTKCRRTVISLSMQYILPLTVKKGYVKDLFLKQMYISNTVASKVYKKGDLIPPLQRTASGTVFEDLKQFKIHRVGYNTGALPFCFFNEYRELVGYDIAMAHKLAADLNCSLEFVPFEYDMLKENVDSDTYHIIMSCVSVVPERFLETPLSKPYMKTTLSFVIPAQYNKQYEFIDQLIDDEDLKIAVLAGSSYKDHIVKLLPNATFVALDKPENFFEYKKMQMCL